MQEFFDNYSEVVAIAVLIVGVTLARLASKGAEIALRNLDERVSRYSDGGGGVGSPRLIRLAKNFVFWIFVLGSVVLALSMLDIRQIPLALDGLFEFLGRVLLGLAIVAVGHLLGLLARRAVEGIGDPRPSLDLGARFAYWAILLIAAVTGLAQLEIDTSFVTQLLLVLIALGIGGLALAFALGARVQVANLLAQRELHRYSVGQRIVVDGVEGIIVEIHATGADLETVDGIAAIPAARFADGTVLRVSREAGDA